jgi:hypothetical protein
MTGETLHVAFTVGGTMACATRRNHLGPILAGLVGMELFMTEGTVKLMHAAIFLDVGKHTEMAASAFGGAEGLEIQRIRIFNLCHFLHCQDSLRLLHGLLFFLLYSLLHNGFILDSCNL